MCSCVPQCSCRAQSRHHCLSPCVLWGQEPGRARTSWTASGARMERPGWLVPVHVSPWTCIPKEEDIPQIRSQPQLSLAPQSVRQSQSILVLPLDDLGLGAIFYPLLRLPPPPMLWGSGKSSAGHFLIVISSGVLKTGKWTEVLPENFKGEK